MPSYRNLAMTVFVLDFMGPGQDGHWFGKFLGVFTTQARAATATWLNPDQHLP
jgi:hypothetical protein